MKKLKKRFRSAMESLESYSCICEKCNCSCTYGCSLSGDLVTNSAVNFVKDNDGENFVPIFLK